MWAPGRHIFTLGIVEAETPKGRIKAWRLGIGEGGEWAQLAHAPLAAKVLFLVHSEGFVQDYLAKAQALERACKPCLQSADKALEAIARGVSEMGGEET